MKKLAELKPGDRFMYGGVEWVKFEDIGAGTLCLAAEPVFRRAFDSSPYRYERRVGPRHGGRAVEEAEAQGPEER